MHLIYDRKSNESFMTRKHFAATICLCDAPGGWWWRVVKSVFTCGICIWNSHEWSGGLIFIPVRLLTAHKSFCNIEILLFLLILPLLLYQVPLSVAPSPALLVEGKGKGVGRTVNKIVSEIFDRSLSLIAFLGATFYFSFSFSALTVTAEVPQMTNWRRRSVLIGGAQWNVNVSSNLRGKPITYNVMYRWLIVPEKVKKKKKK